MKITSVYTLHALVSPVFQRGRIKIFLHQYLKASYWTKYLLIHAVNHCVGKVEIVYGYVSIGSPNICPYTVCLPAGGCQ